MSRLLLIALVVVAACKKESPSGGMPPSSDWNSASGSATAAGSASAVPVSPATQSPHGANPHAGAGGGPASAAVPQTTPPKTLEKTADGRVVLGPFTLAIPKTWTERPVTSSMRAAHWTLTDQPGDELVVFYFGRNGAGPVEANLDRWVGQFQQKDGKPSKSVAKFEKATLAGQAVTLVSVAGHFRTSQMAGGPPPVSIDDGALLGAIVESPNGPYYFKLTGTKKTVDANTAAFKNVLGSLKLR